MNPVNEQLEIARWLYERDCRKRGLVFHAGWDNIRPEAAREWWERAERVQSYMNLWLSPSPAELAEVEAWARRVHPELFAERVEAEDEKPLWD